MIWPYNFHKGDRFSGCTWCRLLGCMQFMHVAMNVFTCFKLRNVVGQLVVNRILTPWEKMNCWTLQMMSWKRMFKLQLWEHSWCPGAVFWGVVSMIWSHFIATWRNDQTALKLGSCLVSGKGTPDFRYNLGRSMIQCCKMLQSTKNTPVCKMIAMSILKNPSHQIKINQGRFSRSQQRKMTFYGCWSYLVSKNLPESW